MKNLFDRSELTANVMLGLAIVVLIACLVFATAVKKPTYKAAEDKRFADQKKAETAITSLKDSLARGEADIAAHIWDVPAQQVGPAVLAKVSDLTKAHNLTLNGFRPQRAADAGELEMLPYQLGLVGTYLDVLRFTQDVESGSGKLAVSVMQIAAADGETDRVSATVYVVAFVKQQTSGASGSGKTL